MILKTANLLHHLRGNNYLPPLKNIDLANSEVM